MQKFKKIKKTAIGAILCTIFGGLAGFFGAPFLTALFGQRADLEDMMGLMIWSLVFLIISFFSSRLLS